MESPKNIIWSPSAQKDLENIMDYLMHNWGKKVATKFLNRLTKLTIQLTLNPEQFPVINQLLEVRKCVVTKQNTLFYQIKGNRIEIIRIYDTRQDPNKLKILFD